MLGVLGLATIGATTPWQLAGWLLMAGLGIGLSTGPSQAAGLSAVSADKSGLGSAALSMARYVGRITGTVVLGFALAPGADASARPVGALWIFAAAFAVSAACGFLLPMHGARGARAARG